MTAPQIRERIVRIDDELRGLPSDAFAQRHVLRSEQDELRVRLRTLLAAELDAASDQWAERAGRKGGHSVVESEQSEAAIRTTRGFTSEGQG